MQPCDMCRSTIDHWPDCPRDEPDAAWRIAEAAVAVGRLPHLIDCHIDRDHPDRDRAVLLAETALDCLDEIAAIWRRVFPHVDVEPF